MINCQWFGSSGTRRTLNATSHGLSVEEIEYVVRNAVDPYPEYIGENKFLVRGRTESGSWAQAIYVFAEDATDIDYAEVDLAMLDDDALYVIHARPLTEREVKALRRRRKRS
jgi:uncharacterized DUF497 family protein